MTICAVAYSFLAVDTIRSLYRANTVRFEVKKPDGVAMRHENSYAHLSAPDWST